MADETMSEFVLGYTRVWHDPKVRTAEQVDRSEMDLTGLSSAFRLDTHGKELLCAVLEHEARGVPVVFYNVIGDVPSDAELQDMADQKLIDNGCSCVMADGNVHDPELNPGATAELHDWQKIYLHGAVFVRGKIFGDKVTFYQDGTEYTTRKLVVHYHSNNIVLTADRAFKLIGEEVRKQEA